MTTPPPDRNLALELVRVTEAAAMGAGRWIGRGDKIAVDERGSMFFPGAAVYMEKIAAGADAVDAIDIDATPTENVRAVAKAKGRRVTDVRVVVLERDRHE